MSDATNTEELVALYALGALEPQEAAEVERLLAADTGAAASFDAYLEVAASLGSGVAGDATPALWDRIAADTRPAPVVELRPRRTRILAAVAVAAVSLSAVLGVALFLQARDTAEPPLAVAVEQTREASGTVVVPMTGDVTAEVVLGSDGIGYVVPGDLPALDDASTYQLWAIVDDRVISAGVLGPRPGIAPFQVDPGVPVAGFALTVEVAGGVVTSDQPAASVGLLDG
ncbi:MAG: anti-sigma factor [Acidimicrobiia bacterium]|nr:anti-sigma factor [Acidimicrobiia bacterium]